ncbi:Extension Ser/Thr-type protein kinase [Rhizoctonia solani]|uniref:cAMP-dependent protein kinase n=1 Tax=Rhizoctonia solani TaxID=456999 RepID=A0A8H7IF44_9AGAM|nr:Extension Ser/Thr-type protein kinase [Rhizoctonia solani]
MTTTAVSWQTTTPFSEERRESVASFYPSPTSDPMSEKDGYTSRRASGMSAVADTGRDKEQRERERAREKEAQVEDEDAGQTVKLTDFDVVSTLGTGTFGRVLLVRLRPAANQPGAVQHFAMKVLKKNEVVRLKQIRDVPGSLERVHAPLIRTGGELFSHLRRAGRFSPDVTRFYLSTIVLALRHLHAYDIIYRDLKPENLLLDHRGYLRITDFGFAKIVQDRTWTLCGTPEYLAPEIIQSAGHSKAVDWWACGILCYEMLVGYPPFFDDNPFGIYDKILRGKIYWPKELDRGSKELIQEFLQPDRSRRLGNLGGGVEDVLLHPWFRGVDWGALERGEIRAPLIPQVLSASDTRNFSNLPLPASADIPGLVPSAMPPPEERFDPHAGMNLTEDRSGACLVRERKEWAVDANLSVHIAGRTTTTRGFGDITQDGIPCAHPSASNRGRIGLYDSWDDALARLPTVKELRVGPDGSCHAPRTGPYLRKEAAQRAARCLGRRRRHGPRRRRRALEQPTSHSRMTNLPGANSLDIQVAYAQSRLRDDGLVEVNPEGRHPIYDLIARAEKDWSAKLARQSRHLADAVDEWDYVTAHNVQLPDEYDTIFHDLEPLWGIAPDVLRETQRGWEDHDGTYTLTSENGKIAVGLHTLGKSVDELLPRANEQVKLLSEVARWLPDFRATFTAHDGPYQFISWELKEAALKAAKTRTHFDQSTLLTGPMRAGATDVHPTRPSSPPNANGTTDQTWKPSTPPDPRRSSTTTPRRRSLSRHRPRVLDVHHPLHSDIRTIPIEQFTEDVGVDPAWNDKPYDKRARLIKLTNEKEGVRSVLRPLEPERAIGKPVEEKSKELNERLMDVAFAGSPIQCEEPVCTEMKKIFEYRGHMGWSDANKYKYIMDIDGNGWSARFKRLMTTNSMILKTTIFPEWCVPLIYLIASVDDRIRMHRYMDRVMPWVHYVPVKVDLTDLYDIITFFRGDAQGRGGHDELAGKIGLAGKVWSKTFYRKEDMVAYLFSRRASVWFWLD